MPLSDAAGDRVALYLEAAARPNTQRSYETALQHYEISWGGLLPATTDGVARYLAAYADSLAINTLKHRLAALAHWHRAHGFADPTRAPHVRKVLKGIQSLHGTKEKRAEPLQLTHLGQIADSLEQTAARARAAQHTAAELRALRDRALILLGFWRGFRGDELIRLQVEYLHFYPDQGMSCYLTHTKADRGNVGSTFKVPMLTRWCPVSAVRAWIETAGLTSGPLFRAITRWGGVSPNALHPNSLIPLLRASFDAAGLAASGAYSGHSLRRGFAGWASANGWDVKTLMEYVGWKDAHSALRYIDAPDPFAQQRIEQALPK